MDIDGPGLGRLVGRQGLHAVEQIDHPLDLGGDHLGQRFLRFVELPVEQLRGAANRGQRVLDFVAEYVGRADRQIGGIAVLALENRTVLRHRCQRDQTPAGIGRQGMNVKVDDTQPAVIAGDHDAAGGQADVPLGQRRVQPGVGEMQRLIDPAADQMLGAGSEQRFTRGIDPADAMRGIDNDQGMAECGQNLIGRRTAVHQAAALFSQGV